MALTWTRMCLGSTCLITRSYTLMVLSRSGLTRPRTNFASGFFLREIKAGLLDCTEGNKRPGEDSRADRFAGSAGIYRPIQGFRSGINHGSNGIERALGGQPPTRLRRER